MHRIENLFAYALFAISGIFLIASDGRAQLAGSNLSDSPGKELAATMPLQAQKATAAPTWTTTDTSVVSRIAKSTKPQTVIQYLLAVPCDGWNTVTINLSGQIQAPIGQSTANNLNSLIDPDLLKEYGCRLEARRILARGQRKITIDAYQFATADGAYGSYCTAHRGSSSYAVQGDASSEDQESISFCKDQYFICLQALEQDDDEAKAVVNSLAKKIIEYIDIQKAKPSANQQNSESNNRIMPYSSKPAVFVSMPTLGRVLGSEKLIVGPISLKRFFPAPYNTSLMPLQKGAVGDYRMEEPHRDRLKLLIAHYPTAQQASLTYTNYTSTLRDQNNEKMVEGFTAPTSLFKVSDSFLLCQLRDKLIIVIIGARHKDTASALAHQIYF